MEGFWRFWDRLGTWQKFGLCFVAAAIALMLLRMLF